MIPFLALLLSTFAFSTSDIRCQANYDKLGIPHQEVSSLRDFYYCFGFHHGKDRAWQMDYFRRVAQGRNAEIYGFSSLKSDLMMKLLNLPKLADRLYGELPEINKQWLTAYAEGVNQGFHEGKKAPEFLDLDYEPENWKPEDSVLVLVLQSFDQTRKTFFRDYEEEKFKRHWKEKTEELFNEDKNPWFDTILKEGEYLARGEPVETTSVQRPFPKLWHQFPTVFGRESGSNNWVVSASKSKNGFAMLANDPHLDLKTPLFWYWINMESPETKVMGSSLPGVPLIISGTNGKVAWGLTNSYINTADTVFLKDYPKDYIESFRPTVKVKFWFLKLPFFFKSFERTIEGQPVLPLELETDEKMVLKWTGFNLTADDLVPMFDLIHTKEVQEMDDVLKRVGLPAWNFVFADNKGDIGYRMVGQAYKHQQKNPYGISSQAWQDFRQEHYLDPMERPHVLKPRRNYVYTANHRHWPLDAEFYGGRAYSYSFRGYRINELLGPAKHDVESFKKIQCDRQAVDARFFVEKILKNIEAPELKGWDFSTHDRSIPIAIYRRFMDVTMDEWKLNEYAFYTLLDRLTSEQKKELQDFYTFAKQQVGGRKWGDFHRVSFPHLSKNEAWKFSPELAGIGDNHSVDPGSSKWDEERGLYEQYSGASMRMIIVMKKEPEIHLSLPGFNRRYSESQTDVPAWKEWKACQYSQVDW